MSLTVVKEANALSSTFRWEVEHICSKIKVGRFLESPKFYTYTDDTTGWRLRLYPRGEKEEYKDYLSLYLLSDVEIKATADLRILNNEGVKVKHTTVTEKVFGKPNKMRGSGKLMSYYYMRDPVNGILNADNKLTIECEIMYKKTSREFGEEEDSVNLPVLQNDLEALFNEPKFYDVVVISEGAALKLHKSILAKRSSVFAGMFDAEMKETLENTVEITDIKYDVLVEMFRFIYAGKVNNMEVIASELAVAADKYALDDLKKRCEMSMMKNMSIDNVIYFLDLADKHCMDELKMMAIQFMIANAAVISQKPEFDSLSRQIVREIFSNLPTMN